MQTQWDSENTGGVGESTTLLRVGAQDSQRGPVRLPSGQVGAMGEVAMGSSSSQLFGTTNADQGLLQGDTSRPAVQGKGQGCEGARGDPEDPSFTRIRSHVRSQREQFPDGTAATDGGDPGDSQGGCGSPEDGATTQEDRAQGGREDLFDGLVCGGRPLKQGDQSVRAVKKQATFEGLVLSPVDVSEKWEPLPMPKARQLAWQAESLVTSTFESLVSHDRVQILEVACSPNSILSETMRELTGSDRTYRCSTSMI